LRQLYFRVLFFAMAWPCDCLFAVRLRLDCGKLALGFAHLGHEPFTKGARGSGFALLASNTPHLVFDDLRARSPLPLRGLNEAERRR